MKSYVVVFASCAVLGAAALAGNGPKTDASAKPKVTAAERIAALGGFVSYPGSQKGSIAFIDTQGVIDVSGDFDEIFGHFRRQIPVKLGLSRAKPGAPKALRTGAGADFAIIFISSDMEPPTVVVPEERYAVVNFAKYAVGLKLPTDEAKYRRRCAKAALKAFVLLCGGGSSRYPGHVASALTPQDLDFTHDKLPIDMQDSIKKYLSAAGVTPLKRTIYQRACQEGWAPAPTNDVQKAIWEKVHAIPDKPITIEFDPKKDK